MKPNYKAFAEHVLLEVLEGSDWDGGSLQELGVKFGILHAVPYDPSIHGPNDVGAEPGDQWVVFINPPKKRP